MTGYITRRKFVAQEGVFRPHEDSAMIFRFTRRSPTISPSAKY
jgi:hypothetical protein